MKVVVNQISIRRINRFNVPDWEVVSWWEFSDFPLSERIQLIMERNIKFYDPEGRVIPTKEAVKSLGLG